MPLSGRCLSSKSGGKHLPLLFKTMCMLRHAACCNTVKGNRNEAGCWPFMFSAKSTISVSRLLRACQRTTTHPLNTTLEIWGRLTPRKNWPCSNTAMVSGAAQITTNKALNLAQTFPRCQLSFQIRTCKFRVTLNEYPTTSMDATTTCLQFEVNIALGKP